MKKDTLEYKTVRIKLTPETIRLFSELKNKIRSLTKNYRLSMNNTLELAASALEREISCNPVTTIRLCLHPDTDFVIIRNKDNRSYYQAYQIICGIDESGEQRKRKKKLSSCGVLPYFVNEGKYRVR